MRSCILVVAAHPDDEILGCGGTVARLVNSGCEVYCLILGTGVTSRYEKNDSQRAAREIKELREQTHAANKIVGVKEVFPHDFPDNQFDSIPVLDIVKAIEKIKNKLKPDTVFTHYEKDLNIDHQMTYKAVITAARPLSNESVKEIYSFEVLSSTEWNYPLSFAPDTFFDISETMDLKLKALKCYKSEIREFPHSRSLQAVELNAKAWGIKVGLKYVEAFKSVRVIR